MTGLVSLRFEIPACEIRTADRLKMARMPAHLMFFGFQKPYAVTALLLILLLHPFETLTLYLSIVSIISS